jgi:L-gulonate 3-dehydrogenase
VVLHRYVTGFVLNRLQSALVREAMGLVAAGVADVAAIDSVVRDGLGLRWALMGPFGVADTNADGGVREYYTRFGQVYTEIMSDLYPTPEINAALIERLGQGADEMVRNADRAKVRRWRDTMLSAIVGLKSENPSPWEGDS